MELWGEDALLQWPGARRPLIQERDAYMARTIWAAASGQLLVALGTLLAAIFLWRLGRCIVIFTPACMHIFCSPIG